MRQWLRRASAPLLEKSQPWEAIGKGDATFTGHLPTEEGPRVALATLTVCDFFSVSH